nr:unnamed protein product [Meloidogyne enterolobii]
MADVQLSTNALRHILLESLTFQSLIIKRPETLQNDQKGILQNDNEKNKNIKRINSFSNKLNGQEETKF